MSFLQHLKRTSIDNSVRWTVKYDAEGKVKEVKQVYNPSDHKLNPLHDKNALIKILEDDKEKNNS